MVEKKDDIIETMTALSLALNKYHSGTQTAQYVDETLKELTKSEGVAFTGKVQYFLNRAQVVKLSDNIKFNDTEKKLWRKVFDFKELGNNLWGANL